MRYFEYKIDNFDFMQNGTTIKDGEQLPSAPICMSRNKIKETLEILKTKKEAFKKLILNFDSLSGIEKLNLMRGYYCFANTYSLEERQISIHKLTHPNVVDIKTDYISKYDTPKGVIYFSRMLRVLANSKTKLNRFKTYSAAEISKMISNGDIIVINNVSNKKVSAKKASTSVMCPHFNLIHPAFSYLDLLTEELLTEIRKQNPILIEEVLNDISLEDIKNDYNNSYLPTYKNCLNYLVKCAEASAAQEPLNRSKLNSQITESYKKEREFNEVKKELIDTSKGR